MKTLPGGNFVLTGLTISLLALGFHASAAAPFNWTWESRALTGNDLFTAATGDGVMVAAGRGGTLLRAQANGVWSVVEADVRSFVPGLGSFWFTRAQYRDGTFVIVGDADTILTSPDGWVWEQQNTPGPSTTLLRDVCLDGPSWVVLGADVTAATEYFSLRKAGDGEWTRHDSSPLSGMTSLAYGQGRWLAVGDGQQTAASEDGGAWGAASPLPAAGNQVAFANDLWVVAGVVGSQAEIMTSPDGTNWSIASSFSHSRSLSTARSIRRLNGRWLVAGSNWLAHSVDGQQWEWQLATDFLIWDISWLGDAYHSVGIGGSLWESADLAGWQEVNPQRISNVTLEALRDLQFANDRWVGIGWYSDIIHSGDGRHWEALDLLPSGQSLNALTHGDGRWVAVGGNQLVESSDGLQWSVRNVAGIASSLMAVAYGNGRWVVVAQGGLIYSSAELEDWELSSQPASSLELAFGGGLFVNRGANFGSAQAVPTLLSTDGLEWEELANPNLLPLVYTHGFWFARDMHNQLHRSSDLANWTLLNWPASALSWPADLVHVDGHWLASAAGRGNLFHSPDGINWAGLKSPLAQQGQLAAGSGEVLLVSAQAGVTFDVVRGRPVADGTVRMSDFEWVEPDAARFRLNGQSGEVLRLEDRSGLNGASTWEERASVPLSADNQLILQRIDPPATSQFFQARPIE